MLCTIQDVLNIPGLSNTAAIPVAWLNALIGAADAHIKSWCKQNLEQAFWTEYYNGHEHPELVIREGPILLGNTTFAASMDGLTLPQTTVNVTTTAGFHPGTAGGTVTLNNPLPGFAIQTGVSTYAYVNYTGTTATSFTGCTGGTGTLATANNRVFSPVVWYDAGGYYGQAPSAFPQSSQLVLGSQYAVELDGGATRQLSKRALLRRIGGSGQGFVGYPEGLHSGKLGGHRLPCWPRGMGNLKVAYCAGYPAYSRELRELSYACAMLVAQMVRIQPSGVNLSSESMGNYSYNVAAAFDTPEMGEVRRVLATYRESSWGND